VGRKIQRPSLALFPETRPTSARAWELVERVPLGAAILAQWKKGAGGKKIGPYYCARFTVDGRQKTVYLGSEAARRELELAWQIVAEEIAAARQAAESPELVRVRELEARASKVKRAKPPPPRGRVATIPILRFGNLK
jgi:hypothetical protein